MGEIMHLFGEIGERNDLIKVLTRYKHVKAAQYVARLSDKEYKDLVPKLNSVIGEHGRKSDRDAQLINVEISRLADKYGALEVATAILTLADRYTASLRGAKMGMNDEDSSTEVARKLYEAMKLERVARYLEGLWRQSQN